MFHSDITFALMLISLSLGVIILLKAKKYSELGVKPCQIIGYVVVILSAIMILISGYGMTSSYFKMRGMMKDGMMQNMMQNMMQGGMMDQQQMENNENMMDQGPHHNK
jgi:hypothetical protein